MAIAVLGLSSCYHDKDLGDPIEILDDYTLPQTGASDAANAKIKGLYDKYGSYFLYDFTEKDAFWKEVMGTGSSSQVYSIIKGDPANVDKMLDFLNDAWLKCFPDDILAKGGVPYRVFLADSVYWTKDFGGGYIKKFNLDTYVGGDNSVIIAGMNRIPKMTAEKLYTLKVAVFATFFNSYVEKGYIDFPDTFYKVSDYENCPDYERIISGTNSETDFRSRGFVPTYNPDYGYFSDWFYNTKWNKTWKDAKANDRSSFISLLLYANDAKLEEEKFLTYPLIKQKWDILVNYYLEKYHIDIRNVVNG